MSHPYLHILSFILLLSACAGVDEHAGEEVDPAPPGEMVAVSFCSFGGLATKAGEGAGGVAETDPALADDVQVIVYAYKEEAAGGVLTSAPLVTRT